MPPGDSVVVCLSTKRTITRLTTGSSFSFRPLAVAWHKTKKSQLSFPNSSFFHLQSPPPNPLLGARKEGRSPGWHGDTQRGGTAHPKRSDAHRKALVLFKPQPALQRLEKVPWPSALLAADSPQHTPALEDTIFFPVFSLLLPSTTAKPIITAHIKKLFIWSSDRFLQKGWGLFT